VTHNRNKQTQTKKNTLHTFWIILHIVPFHFFDSPIFIILKFCFAITNLNILYYKTVILNSKNIVQNYCFYCIFDQINVGSVNMRDFCQNH